MERSRSKQHSRLKKEKSRRRTRTALALLSVAALCAAGVWFGFGRQGTGTADQPADAVQTPAATVQPSATPLAAVLTPSPAATVSPSSSIQPAASQAPAVVLQPSAPSAGSVSGDGVKMAFTGDVIFASTVETVLKKNGYDYPYRELSNELKQPDLTVANLESPITTRGAEQKKEYTYRSSPQALKPFKEAGFDVVNLANNHIMDYGAEGLLDTIQNLDKEGILHAGAGKDTAAAYKPAVVERNGIRIAFLGFSHKVPDSSWKAGSGKPGTTQLYDTKPALEAIANAKKDADLVVVMAHWGEERHDKPEETHRTMARKFIDAGADLIIGTHPHVLQGFEQYKGKWIAYSLGNFLFTTNTYPATWDTVILNAACTKAGGCSLSAVPVSNKFARPVPMDQAEGKALFERLTSISYGAKVDGQGNILADGGSAR